MGTLEARWAGQVHFSSGYVFFDQIWSLKGWTGHQESSADAD